MEFISALVLVASTIALLAGLLCLVASVDEGKITFIVGITLSVIGGSGVWWGSSLHKEAVRELNKITIIQISTKQGRETCRVLLQRGLADFILIPRNSEVKVEKE